MAGGGRDAVRIGGPLAGLFSFPKVIHTPGVGRPEALLFRLRLLIPPGGPLRLSGERRVSGTSSQGNVERSDEIYRLIRRKALPLPMGNTT